MDVLLSAWLCRLFHGGVEKRLHETGLGLTKKDHNVTMLCAKTWWGSEYPHDKPYKELNSVIPFSPYRFGARFKKRLEIMAMHDSVKRIKNSGEHFDVCHARGVGGWPAVKSGIPTVNDMPGRALGATTGAGPLGAMMRECAMNTDHFIAVSNFARENLIKDGIDRDKISVIYTGVPVKEIRSGSKEKAIKALNLDPNKKYLLSVQNLNVKKRTQALIDFFVDIVGNKSDWELLIVGEGPLQPIVSNEIAKREITNVRLLGFQSELLFDLYNLADAFALCSYREGAPIVYFEAIAAGLPTVATNSGATYEYLIDGYNALVSEEQDDLTFKANLAKVLNDASLRAELSENALVSSEQYDMGRFISQCEETYDLALKHFKRR